MAKERRKDNKGRVLKKGESQRKDLIYTYRWIDASKKRQCIYDATLEGLRKQEEKIQLELLQGITRENITLNQLIEIYFKTKSSLATSTSENYQYYFNHSIKSDWVGGQKVINIRKSDLLMFYKRKKEEGLSNGTIHILHKIIHPALQLGVDDDIIRKNPADGCMKEYPEESEAKYALTFSEEGEFLRRIRERPRMKRYYPLYAIMLHTGIRIGEALGLTWDDVDLTNRSISINHQLQYRAIDGKSILYCTDNAKRRSRGKTKTKAGERIIPMTQQVYELFIAQRKEWLKIQKDSSFEVDGYRDFVFLSHRTGRNLYPSNVRRMINRIVAMNDECEVKLPEITPHILRHTACTRYAESGMDIKTVQYLMGHSDVKTTIKVYNHTDLERTKRELEKLNSFRKSYNCM